MALSTLSSVLRSKYKNTVGDYDISYETTRNAGEKVTEVLASVKKGELRVRLCKHCGQRQEIDSLGRWSLGRRLQGYIVNRDRRCGKYFP